MKKRKIYILSLIVIVLAILLMFLFVVPQNTVIKNVQPRTGMACTSLSDCPKDTPGLEPMECKEYEGEKVCWYGDVCNGPLACNLFDMFCVCIH